MRKGIDVPSGKTTLRPIYLEQFRLGAVHPAGRVADAVGDRAVRPLNEDRRRQVGHPVNPVVQRTGCFLLPRLQHAELA